MPKLPLFKDEPLNPDAVATLRYILEHPDIGENTALINELRELKINPNTPMTERLAYFLIESGLLQSVMLQNFVVNSIGTEITGTSKAATMRLQINQRLLAHAAAADSFLLDKKFSGCKTRGDHGAKRV